MLTSSIEFSKLESELSSWLDKISEAPSFAELDKIKTSLVGKSGAVTAAFKTLKDLPTEEKKNQGEKLNKIKDRIENAISSQTKKLEKHLISEKLKNETVDITLPVENERFGGLHLITQAVRTIRDYYLSRGFRVLDGPEIETDFFNFTALNTPEHHPARQSSDTFYIDGLNETLLRTQTSCVQIRAMINEGIPIRMVSIGKTYRNDKLDATHSPMFHQIEGLVVDKKPISIGHLKSELMKFISFFFEIKDVAIRFRPSFFPFTEPGMEFDCRYTKKDGKIIVTPNGDKWLEMGGAGMVHPNVFRNCGITEQAYGFAYGIGVDRLIMIKHGIQDIRNLFDTDSRWLRYYGL
ncbi:MAG: phenylalanine--tRNA ligase subunit alpha [Holosporales bacterium]|jgi:phenylalanyl-tRNA synthetase alpha chain|nr:phenylalanine--tRNA ligase subunit alpha [Holosporales bacterium]